MPTRKQPLSNEEKALRKQQRLEKEADAQIQKKEMDAYFHAFPGIILNLLSELDKESIDYTLKQPEPDKFKLIIYSSGFSLAGECINFELSQDGYSYFDYCNLVYDIDDAFSVIESTRRSRLEEEENHRKRQAACAKLTVEERKLLGL
jgi:hypothetical protein